MFDLYLSPAVSAFFDTSSDIEALYRHYFSMTCDSQSASNLVLAHVTAQKAPPPERLIDTEEAAGILNVSQSLVQAMASDGRLRHVRLGKLIRFRKSWLEDDAMTPENEPGRHW